MFGITYDTWQKICNMYFSLSDKEKKTCLQWFPFTKLSKPDEEVVSSKEFYNEYISTGSFVMFPAVIHQSENYLQKGDGSFRDSALIGPILYLILQAIGMEIHNYYIPIRPSGISVYYAGNYKWLRPKYKKDYDDFFKELNMSIDEYQYFIKTDITNFFSNISIDKLIEQIDAICNSKQVKFSQNQLHLFKEIIKYCGDGKFPLVENSMASSFLATVVYLDPVDKHINDYISKRITDFTSFSMVRYVDDMYILISTDKPQRCIHEDYNEIRNAYSSILKEYGLSLNSNKCCLMETKEINNELKKSLYDEYFNGIRHNIEEHFDGKLHCFLNALSDKLLYDSVDVETYNELINEYFSSDGIEFTPSEVFNYFVYENDEELQHDEIIKDIIELIERSISFISIDPKRLTAMIMKTKSSQAIKSFLNQLFKRNRSDKWNSYDTMIAISYLIQSEFRHTDLINVISIRNQNLYNYYLHNCRDNMLECFDSRINSICKIISQDSKVNYIYFMYVCEIKRSNYMVAFAYCKSFFDRITADLDYVLKQDPKLKQPNYKMFYHEHQLIQFYACINNSEQIIKTACKLRNANPLLHSSSELLDGNNTSNDLRKSMEDLLLLVYKYISKQIK